MTTQASGFYGIFICKPTLISIIQRKEKTQLLSFNICWNTTDSLLVFLFIWNSANVEGCTTTTTTEVLTFRWCWHKWGAYFHRSHLARFSYLLLILFSSHVGMGSWTLFCSYPSSWVVGLPKSHWYRWEDWYLVTRMHIICDNVRINIYLYHFFPLITS